MAHVSPHDSHSASTPPPSPPLPASRRTLVSKQLPAPLQSNNVHTQRERARPDSVPQAWSWSSDAVDSPCAHRRSPGRRSQHSFSESPPRGMIAGAAPAPAPATPSATVTAAAAAVAAAASYTSHELAIAYSMVTSDTPEEGQPDEDHAEQREEERRQQRQQRRQLEQQKAKHRDQAKLDQPHPEDGSDALSSLWKKTVPIQEPYFRTRHTIASQHTLSTLGGVLFSLDEVPAEFNQDMYIAMRNRIFELEAKAVNYSPFSHSRKRSIDRSDLDDYPGFRGYGTDNTHYSKRASHGQSTRSSRSHGYPLDDHQPSPAHRPSSSYPSWYTPEVYTNGSRYPQQFSRREVEYNGDPRSFGPPHYEIDSDPASRPGSPQLAGHHQQALPPMRTGHTPPPSGNQGRPNPPPHSYRPPPQSLDPHPSQARHEERPTHPGSPDRSYAVGDHVHPHPTPNPVRAQAAGHGPPSHLSQQPSHSQPPPAHHPPHPHAHHSQQPQQQQQTTQAYPPLHHRRQPHPQHLQHPPNGPAAGAQPHANPMNSVGSDPPMSVHQQRHRAQQQAQSAHSRSYHLHKHMRMLDQQRAAQLAAQQQQHEKQKQAQQQQQHPQQQQQQQQQQQSGQPFKPIQRHYQPHQQMYPVHNQPIAIKPHPQPPQAQQVQQQQRQQQILRPSPFQPQQRSVQQQQQHHQHQLLQRYHQQRQLQQKQHQLRQLQLLRSRSSAAPYPTQKNSHYAVAASPGSHSPTPPRVFGPQVDRPIKKSTRPLECSNCMALDSVTWRPKVDDLSAEDSSLAGSTGSANDGDASTRSKILCPPCTLYLETHGKPRPVGTFRANFLKKIHTRFKRELQEVRFQGWQDAQVLEIEDRMSEREFQMVFNGLDDSDASQITSGQVSASGSPAPVSSSASGPASTTVDPTVTASGATSDASEQESKKPGDAFSSVGEAKTDGNIVIKIEDDDDDAQALTRKAQKPENVEVRTFQSEASVGELFGHRWRTEPVVGYTLVHFGGSDRTRMVPMNPTVPSLSKLKYAPLSRLFFVVLSGLFSVCCSDDETRAVDNHLQIQLDFLAITFNRSEQSITFAFRVLVNGLCLLSSGGGPPALHMPEMADDDESEEDEEEIVVVPDNDKEDRPSPSPPPPPPTSLGLPTTDSGAAQDGEASSLALTAAPSKGGEVAAAGEAANADVRVDAETPVAVDSDAIPET
ncbi:unnamed protein product [Mortierella alpina]